MIRKTALYVRDIIANMHLAEQFVGDLTFEQFTTDLKPHLEQMLRDLEAQEEV